MSGIWLLPTIDRPQGLQRFIDSFNEVEETAQINVMIWRYGPYFDEYLALDYPPGWHLTVQNERFTVADAMRFTVKAYPEADFYGFLADDLVIKTKFSDRLAAAATPFFIAYPDDGFQHELLCTHFVVGGDLVRKIGWWALPELVHTNIDMAWMVLGHNCTGMLRYCPDVVLEHFHPLANKAPTDDTYRYAQAQLVEDNAAFKIWQSESLDADVKRARELFYA